MFTSIVNKAIPGRRPFPSIICIVATVNYFNTTFTKTSELRFNTSRDNLKTGINF